MFIESYEDCMARFDKKLKRNYRFVVNPWKEIVMTEQAVQRLLEKVEDNIRSRELQGINQDTTRALLQALHDANEADDLSKVPKQAFTLYKELVIEANAQLGLFKMPESAYGQYKELIKAT